MELLDMFQNRGNIIMGWYIVVFLMMFFLPYQVLAVEIEEEIDSDLIEENESVIDSDLNFLTEDEIVEDGLEVKSREEILNQYSDGMEFQEDKVVIQQELDDFLFVGDILKKIDILGLQNDYSIQDVVVTDLEDNLLEEDDICYNGYHIVVLGEHFIRCYFVQFLGDFNQDNVLDSNDIDYGIEQVIQGNNEICAEDISYVDYVLESHTYDRLLVEEEQLENHLQLVDNKDVYVGDKVVVSYAISGFSKNYMNVIAALMDYDHSLLRLENIYVLVDGEVRGKWTDNQFIYLFDEYQSNEVFLILLFQTLQSGSAKVSFRGIKAAMNGGVLDLETSASLEVMILEYGKGGDVEIPPSNMNSSFVGEEQNFLKQQNYFIDEEKASSSITRMNVILSNDNYIENLVIKGYSISFDKDINYYSILVDEQVHFLELEVFLSHDNASYIVSGNENFKIGENEVILTVVAEDGSSRDYVILVHKRGSDEDKVLEEKEDNKFRKMKRIVSCLVLVLLVFSIIWLIYRILKADD